VNAPSDITVIRARLPYIDRRALSQAWYEALRLGADAGQAVPMLPRRKADEARRPNASHAPPSPLTTAPPSVAAAAQKRRVPYALRGADGRRPFLKTERTSYPNASRPPTARRATPVYGAGFTVALGGARVRIVVRGEGMRLALTAVCTARHAEAVRLALAHASLGLRLDGALVNTTVHCEESAR